MKLLLVTPLANYPQAHPALLPNTDFPAGFAYLNAALKLTEQVGFGDNVIFGGPAESLQAALESLEFYKKYCLYAQVNAGSIPPHPGKSGYSCCFRGLSRTGPYTQAIHVRTAGQFDH